MSPPPRCHLRPARRGAGRTRTSGKIPGAIHISLVPESGWPHPILGTGEWVAPSNPRSATSEPVRRSRGRSLPSTQTGSRRSRAHPGHLSRQSRSGNGPRLRPRHSQDGPSNHAPTRNVCTADAVASLRARFSHSCGINVSVASLGRYARTCERYHGLFSPGSRPTASSQTWSASPTGLRARWACGLMVLGATKC